MKPLVTILARAGSKRLPGKHLLDFCGKPLIEWTIDQAFEWRSANDAHMILYSDIEGIKTSFMQVKREDDAGDEVTKITALRNALQKTEWITEGRYEAIVDLDATNPLRTQAYIDRAWELFVAKRPPLLMSVTPARRSPYRNQRLIAHWGGAMLPCGNPGSNTPPQVWDVNANIYIYSREWLLDGDSVEPDSSGALLYEMPGWTYLDIDEEWDFVACEALFKQYVLGDSNDA